MDGMKIKDGFIYNIWNGEILGMEDLDGLASTQRSVFDQSGLDNTKPAMAKEVFALMVTTFDGKHRVPIGYYLAQSTFAGLVAEMVDSALIALAKIGLSVRAIVCDGAAEQRRWQKDEVQIWPPRLCESESWLPPARRRRAGMTPRAGKSRSRRARR